MIFYENEDSTHWPKACVCLSCRIKDRHVDGHCHPQNPFGTCGNCPLQYQKTRTTTTILTIIRKMTVPRPRRSNSGRKLCKEHWVGTNQCHRSSNQLPSKTFGVRGCKIAIPGFCNITCCNKTITAAISSTTPSSLRVMHCTPCLPSKVKVPTAACRMDSFWPSGCRRRRRRRKPRNLVAPNYPQRLTVL